MFDMARPRNALFTACAAALLAAAAVPASAGPTGSGPTFERLPHELVAPYREVPATEPQDSWKEILLLQDKGAEKRYAQQVEQARERERLKRSLQGEPVPASSEIDRGLTHSPRPVGTAVEDTAGALR